MQIDELVNFWLNNYNEKYSKYIQNRKEPRYYLKQFFFYSYNLLSCLENNWEEYLRKYEELFKRDPANDYYGYRNPNSSSKSEARRNSVEWTIIFEIINKIGFPHNFSAKTKLIKNAKGYLLIIKKNPEQNLHDIMLCSAVKNLPNTFKEIDEWLPSWIREKVKDNNLTMHQLIAYINVIKEIPNLEETKNKIIETIINWINSPKGTDRKKILILARIVVDLEWIDVLMKPPIYKLIKELLFKNLDNIHNLDWPNSALILQAVYKLCDSSTKEFIHNEISRNIVPSKLFELKEIFPFLNASISLLELQDEIESIKEKCNNSPSKENCHICMNNPRGLCWIRILSKILDVSPRTHSPFEVADVVIYTLQQGIYFVIKSEEISGLRGEGDVLLRQCSKLFSNNFALVLYWNPCSTHPMVIEQIKRIADRMSTTPKFLIIDHKYIRQVLNYYNENFT